MNFHIHKLYLTRRFATSNETITAVNGMGLRYVSVVYAITAKKNFKYKVLPLNLLSGLTELISV